MFNDFPILNDQDYLLLNKQYNLQSGIDRTTTVANVYLQLMQATNACSFIANSVNKSIRDLLNESHNQLITICENLDIIFNLNMKSSNQVVELNIFSFLKNISTAIDGLMQLSQHETKEHIKLFIDRTCLTLIQLINKFLESLSKSNIRLYKYI